MFEDGVEAWVLTSWDVLAVWTRLLVWIDSSVWNESEGIGHLRMVMSSD